MKPNRLSTKKNTLRFAVILSALVLTGCASTQSTTSSTFGIFRFLYREHGQHLWRKAVQTRPILPAAR